MVTCQHHADLKFTSVYFSLKLLGKLIYSNTSWFTISRWRYIWKKWGGCLIEDFSWFLSREYIVHCCYGEDQLFTSLFDRDLLDLSKDNLQIKESKTQGIYIAGATEVRTKYMALYFILLLCLFWNKVLSIRTSIFCLCCLVSVIPADIYREQFGCIREPLCKFSWVLLWMAFSKQICI
jgi:hypothetical protein